MALHGSAPICLPSLSLSEAVADDATDILVGLARHARRIRGLALQSMIELAARAPYQTCVGRSRASAWR
eukprot:4358242-Lingulodinium_polyedra.AAC.1